MLLLFVKYPVKLKESVNKKYVAVPFHGLHIDDNSELSLTEIQVMFNVTSQELEDAPGFKIRKP